MNLNANNPTAPRAKPRPHPICPNCERSGGLHFPTCPNDRTRPPLTYRPGCPVSGCCLCDGRGHITDARIPKLEIRCPRCGGTGGR